MTTTTELAAGRELDALVAEKVMGLRRVECYYSDGDYAGPLWYGEKDDCWGAVGMSKRLAFSSDIAAAWPVFEKLAVSPYSCALMFIGANESWNNKDEWRVSRGYEYGDFIAAADTAPLAICRAALKAVGA